MDGTYRRLLLIQVLLAAANSMAVVFGMVFFLRSGFSAGDVVLFNLIGFAVASLACVAVTRVADVRPRTSMAAGLAALAASYAAYLVLPGWSLLLFVAVAWGAYIPLFFLPFNVLVIGTTKREDRAGKIATFILAYTAVGIAGPAIGGAVIDVFDPYGYASLFGIATTVLAADIVFILRLVESSEPMGFTFDFPRIGPRTGVALFAEGGFEGMSFGVVPIIAYGFTTAELDLGGLFSLFALAGGIITVVLGVWSDRLRNRRSFLFLGAATSATASLLVVRAGSFGGFAVGESLLALTASIAPLFLFAITVERVPGGVAAAVVTREVLLNAGRATSLAAYFVLLAVGLTPQQAFLLAAVSLAFVALGEPAIEGRPAPAPGSYPSR